MIKAQKKSSRTYCGAINIKTTETIIIKNDNVKSIMFERADTGKRSISIKNENFTKHFESISNKKSSKGLYKKILLDYGYNIL